MISGIYKYNFSNNIILNRHSLNNTKRCQKFNAYSFKSDIFFSGSKKDKSKSYINNVKKYIEDKRALEVLKNSKYNDEKRLIADSINSINGIYSSLRKENWNEGKDNYCGSFGAFLNDCFSVSAGEIIESGEIPSDIEGELEYFSIDRKDFIKDIQLSVKYAPLNNYLKKYEGDDFLDYMYEKYYLENIQSDIKVPKNVIQKCLEINKKYGTKIFLSSDTKDIKNTLKFIEEEFKKWDKAGKDKVVYPSIIDFSTADYY